LALTSPIGGGRSVGIVRSRTKATEFSFSFVVLKQLVFGRGVSNFKKTGNESINVTLGHVRPAIISTKKSNKYYIFRL
jgi:hypothetical protein